MSSTSASEPEEYVSALKMRLPSIISESRNRRILLFWPSEKSTSATMFNMFAPNNFMKLIILSIPPHGATTHLGSKYSLPDCCSACENHFMYRTSDGPSTIRVFFPMNSVCAISYPSTRWSGKMVSASVLNTWSPTFVPSTPTSVVLSSTVLAERILFGSIMKGEWVV